MIARPLLYVPVAVASGGVAIYFGNGPMPKIEAQACLSWAFVGAGATSPLLDGALEFLEC